SIDATTTIRAKAFRSGWTDSAIASGAYTMKVVPPTFSPTSGSYPSPQAIAMSTTTPSSTIRYTTNGSEPTGTSPVYTAPITTGKARAYKDSFTPSAVATASFAVDAAGAVDTPLIVPAGGRFTAGVTAVVTVQASGATLRYTTTGVDPTASDPVVPGGGITVD